tara:strand:+ start:501 stop:638 length:138 start_codon:yes stop_codon:yes gene_type:complete
MDNRWSKSTSRIFLGEKLGRDLVHSGDDLDSLACLASRDLSGGLG